MTYALDFNLDHLRSSFSAGDIATLDPITIPVSANIAEWLMKDEYTSFDFFPVTQDASETIIGLLDRKTGEILPLSSSLLIATHADILNTLERLDQNGVLLVVDDHRIAGIITKADAQKLPVRAFAFALITHLESLMGYLIELHYKSPDEWMSLVSSDRQKKIRDKKDLLERQRMDPSLVECCDFCDKRKIIRKTFHLQIVFEKDLKKIEDLRNSIAHAGQYISSQEEMHEFIKLLHTTMTWIEELHKLATSQQIACRSA